MNKLKNFFFLFFFFVFLGHFKITALSEETVNPDNFLPLQGIFSVPKGADSSVSNNIVTVTKNLPSQIGSIFSNKDFRLDLTKKSNAEMYLKINGNADGLTFIMHALDWKVTEFSGSLGENLGVYADTFYTNGTMANCFYCSFVVEFDTYVNFRSTDYYSDRGSHIANAFPGEASTYKKVSTGARAVVHNNLQYTKLNTNTWTRFLISWEPIDDTGGIFSYKYGDLDWVSVKIPYSIFCNAKQVYWGFTGSTGEISEQAQVAFYSVPGLIYYDDTLKIFDTSNNLELSDKVKSDSELLIEYEGVYAGGKYDFNNPHIEFPLPGGIEYISDTFSINGENVVPTISGNSLQVELPNLNLASNKVKIKFKVKLKDLYSFDKFKITSIVNADNYTDSQGKEREFVVDSSPPKGVGNIQVVKKDDSNSLLESPKANILKSYEDDISSKEAISINFKDIEDIKEKAKKYGPTSFVLTLSDEVNNTADLTIPMFVVYENEKTASNSDFLLKAQDINIRKSFYPKTVADLKSYILNDSDLELYEVNNENLLESENPNLVDINIDGLPKPGDSITTGTYTITFNYKTVSLKINMNIIKDKVDYPPGSIKGNIDTKGEKISVSLKQFLPKQIFTDSYEDLSWTIDLSKYAIDLSDENVTVSSSEQMLEEVISKTYSNLNNSKQLLMKLSKEDLQQFSEENGDKEVTFNIEVPLVTTNKTLLDLYNSDNENFEIPVSLYNGKDLVSKTVASVTMQPPTGEGIDTVVKRVSSTKDLDASKLVTNLKSMLVFDTVEVLGFDEEKVFDDPGMTSVNVNIRSKATGVESKVKVTITIIEEPLAYVSVPENISLEKRDKMVQGIGKVSYNGVSDVDIQVDTMNVLPLESREGDKIDLQVYKSNQIPLKELEHLTVLSKKNTSYDFFLKAPKENFKKVDIYKGVIMINFELLPKVISSKE
ncbi:MAG: hypothetical protein LBM95_10005 [Lactobacillales bacterium]|jgi:hypothetical protein|nr:hypothetical protein [Lactobacillales bacterium]